MVDIKLVHNMDLCAPPAVDAESVLNERVLRSEAVALASLVGPNPYSNFVLKLGQRPDRSTAATIGRLMGTRVRASDGTMQPPRTAAERLALKESRRLRKIARQKQEQAGRFCAVLDDLAAHEDDPIVIIEAISGLDEPEISKKLSKSIEWLQRFAEEWQGRGKQQEIGGGS